MKQIYVNVWSQYLQYMQSHLKIFIHPCLVWHHLAAAMPFLKINNISPVYQYIIEIWSVLMACTWKNRVLLAAFWDIVWRWLENGRIQTESLEKSIFAWLVPKLVPKQNSRFQVFSSTICCLWWLINIYETFGAKKIAISLWNVVFAQTKQLTNSTWQHVERKTLIVQLIWHDFLHSLGSRTSNEAIKRTMPLTEWLNYHERTDEADFQGEFMWVWGRKNSQCNSSNILLLCPVF